MITATKQQIIDHGMDYLSKLGVEVICQVCILNGGSCCKGCIHLKDRSGCQLRNISCTGWLCGFQQYIFHEMGLLEQWNTFWQDIPGQDFRQDFTPPEVKIEGWMDPPDARIRSVTSAFAKDLHEQTAQKKLGLPQLNDKLFSSMDKITFYKDSELIRYTIKKQKILMKDFQHFKVAKLNYDNFLMKEGE
ncbi:hypothetical protein [Paenibacillus rigui]|uniref:DNA mismatch repair protein n=1 Tax=Paenibacillus rigui TaxID=554312 RepID=A0A229UG07_9BACL|nr:hypothetical protein [Paenibacillus rigui]OXM82316.1 hypothetical protein CF651_31565 [Paenibacillus rigui]